MCIMFGLCLCIIIIIYMHLYVHVYVHIHILVLCPNALYVVNNLSACKAC